MKINQILDQLKALSDKSTLTYNTKHGVGENQFGVKLGDIRKIAKDIKSDHQLAMELWKTENFDARMLATLILKPKELTATELDALVRSVKYARVSDWLNSYVVKIHPDNETLRQQWMTDNDPMALRSGWYLTTLRVENNPEMVDVPSLLNRIENEMGVASPDAQWTMNFCLAAIGINHPNYRKRAIEIGEKLGVYRDYPVSKGCVSPFAPVWINEMVKRQQAT